MSNKKNSKPNIIFVLTDDQRWDTMGCAGNSIIQTPNMDELAAEGTRFTNMFVTSPICAASRASIFTGLYERTHQFTFSTPPLADEYINRSYPVMMKQAGYNTGFVGKFGVKVEDGAQKKMFDYYESLFRAPYMKEQPDGSKRHLTDITGDKAVEYLDLVASGDSDKPFCLSISFNAPHAEDNDPRQYIWPQSCDELYNDVEIPVPETMNEDFFESHPDFIKNSFSKKRFDWRFNTPEKYQKMVKGYYRMISGVDNVLGRIRNKLQELKLADNTVIIFTGDNGYFLGERGFAGKWYLYEYSLRVPLIIYDPRKEKNRGRVIDSMALNVDLPVTMLDYIGAEIPELMQGNSLLPLLSNNNSSWRSHFLCEHLFDHESIPMSEGVRTQKHTYINWMDYEKEELYDHQNDFEQVNDLIDNPEYSNTYNELNKLKNNLTDKYIKSRL